MSPIQHIYKYVYYIIRKNFSIKIPMQFITKNDIQNFEEALIVVNLESHFSWQLKILS